MLPDDDAKDRDNDPRLPDGHEEAAPPPSGARERSWGSATLAGCIVLEALILLVLVAFCATLVGVSFLRQALLAAPPTATPTVAALIEPEPSPTATETATPAATETPTPAPVTPTLAPATPTVAAPTPTPTATPAPTPRLFRMFLPIVVRAPTS